MKRLNRILNISDHSLQTKAFQGNRLWLGLLLTGIILAFQLPDKTVANANELVPDHFIEEIMEVPDEFKGLHFKPAIIDDKKEDEIILKLNETEAVLVPLTPDELQEKTKKESRTIIDLIGNDDKDIEVFVFGHGDAEVILHPDHRKVEFYSLDSFPEYFDEEAFEDFHHSFDSLLKHQEHYLRTFEWKHNVFDSLFKNSEKNLFQKEKELAELMKSLPKFEFDEDHLFELKEMEESFAEIAREQKEQLEGLYESEAFRRLQDKESWLHEAEILRELKEQKLFENLPEIYNEFHFEDFPHKINDLYFDGFHSKLGGLDRAFESEMNELGIKERNENYKLELSRKHLKIDGKKQPDYIHERFVEIYEEIKGKPLGKKSKVVIQLEE